MNPVPVLVLGVALVSGVVGFVAARRRVVDTTESDVTVYRRALRVAAVPALALLHGLSLLHVLAQLPGLTSDRGVVNVAELLQRVAATTAFLVVCVPAATVVGFELADDG